LLRSRPETEQGGGTDTEGGTALGDSSTPPPGDTQPVSSATDPLAGRVLSHYRLEERLGAGGMGMLYRATDLKLGRAVAIKLLARHLVSDETAKARFIREARAASALDHPNIATVHEIGEAEGELFIAMALYEGETLKQRLDRGRLAVAEGVGILRQVLLGLEAAHRAGIVHRDIKPANVLVTSGEVVKILDFGVAKLASEGTGQGMTEAGQAVGTVLYMSPEQLRGQAVSQRSDLWSLGVLAYELLSGVTPFQADSSVTGAMRILNDEPPPLTSVPGVPVWLADLVAQLLRKDPSQRPQSASEVLRRLEAAPEVKDRALSLPQVGLRPRFRIAASFTFAVLAIAALASYLYIQRREGPNTAGRVKSLVVLPFINASPNADAEYLSDGIADGLINSLSQIPELRVIARTTAFRFKGKEADLQKLGRELSVDAVLTGRLQQVGDTLVIQADLVNLGNGSELWGDRYNRKLTDVLSVQEEITQAISQKLRPRLTADEQRPLKKHYTDNPEAYQLYLRGRYFWNKRNEEGFTRAIDYFQKAIELEPSFALAYAGLADSYVLQPNHGFTNDGYAKGETAARKALALDDELGEAHATLAFIAWGRWDWVNAEKGFKRAIALNPNYATAHHWYGQYLRSIAHREEALAELKRAQQLDPLSWAITTALGAALYDMGLYDRAIAAFKEALEMSPAKAPLNTQLADCYVKKNMYREAISRSQEALALSENKAFFRINHARIYALTGNKDDALTILNELKTREAEDLEGQIAQVYVALNDKESAFKWLEIAYQRRSKELLWLKLSAYEPLRADPRYADLVRRIGFPQ